MLKSLKNAIFLEPLLAYPLCGTVAFRRQGAAATSTIPPGTKIITSMLWATWSHFKFTPESDADR